MLRTLHSVAAVAFFLLAGSFFVAALCLQNAVEPLLAAWWMQVADLPLLVSALVYGGSALYFGLKKPGSSPGVLGWILLLLLAAVFIFFAVLNFLGS